MGLEFLPISADLLRAAGLAGSAYQSSGAPELLEKIWSSPPGSIDYSQFNIPFGGMAAKSQQFAEQAKRAGLKPGTSAYADVERAFYETNPWALWGKRDNLAEAAVRGRMQREAVQREQDRNIRLATQGMTAYMKAEVEGDRMRLPLQKELMGLQNDYAIRQIEHQFMGQGQLQDKELQSRLDLTQLTNSYNRKNFVDDLNFRSREGAANREVSYADIRSRENLGYAGIRSQENLGYAGIRSQERQQALGLAAQRELAKMEQASRTRGQNLDFISNSNATSGNVIASAINRRFY